MYAGILLLVLLCLFGFLYVVKTYKSAIELQNFSRYTYHFDSGSLILFVFINYLHNSLESKEISGGNDYRSNQTKLLHQRLLELEKQIKNNSYDTCPVCFGEVLIQQKLTSFYYISLSLSIISNIIYKNLSQLRKPINS